MDERAWRAEQACADAWPSQRTPSIGDWRVHVSGGATRRADSASPATLAPHLDRDTLSAIERVYSGVGQQTLMRVPGLATGIDALLDAAGFEEAEAPTQTILASIDESANGSASIETRPGAQWLATRARLAPRITRYETEATVARITGPVAFVRRDRNAVAYGTIARGLLVIEAVATDPAHRRHGLARDCIATLMAWAHARGVTEACLQVEADNQGAIALYEGLGFTTHLHDYHYRRRSRR